MRHTAQELTEDSAYRLIDFIVDYNIIKMRAMIRVHCTHFIFHEITFSAFFRLHVFFCGGGLT